MIILSCIYEDGILYYSPENGTWTGTARPLSPGSIIVTSGPEKPVPGDPGGPDTPLVVPLGAYLRLAGLDPVHDVSHPGTPYAEARDVLENNAALILRGPPPSFVRIDKHAFDGSDWNGTRNARDDEDDPHPHFVHYTGDTPAPPGRMKSGPWLLPHIPASINRGTATLGMIQTIRGMLENKTPITRHLGTLALMAPGTDPWPYLLDIYCTICTIDNDGPPDDKQNGRHRHHTPT